MELSPEKKLSFPKLPLRRSTSKLNNTTKEEKPPASSSENPHSPTDDHRRFKLKRYNSVSTKPTVKSPTGITPYLKIPIPKRSSTLINTPESEKTFSMNDVKTKRKSNRISAKYKEKSDENNKPEDFTLLPKRSKISERRQKNASLVVKPVEIQTSQNMANFRKESNPRVPTFAPLRAFSSENDLPAIIARFGEDPAKQQFEPLSTQNKRERIK